MLVTPRRPDHEQLVGIRALLSALTAQDGTDPLSDQALTHLTDDSVEHALVVDGDKVAGYAQLDGRSLEIAARTDAIAPLLDQFAGRPLLVWSHGHASRLPDLLEQRGFVAQRELHQLRRPLRDPVEVPAAPAGVDIRPFVVGSDEAAWLAVNAAAFADHPEQGRWTRTDLEARMSAPWFDPDGFLLAWHENELVGFHWTKVHVDGAGEVYVIGVAPAAQGTGLGTVLLLRGLAHLQRRGCPEVTLYVDGSNTGAMHLYERYGFARFDLHVQWASPEADAQLSTSTGSVSKT